MCEKLTIIIKNKCVLCVIQAFSLILRRSFRMVDVKIVKNASEHWQALYADDELIYESRIIDEFDILRELKKKGYLSIDRFRSLIEHKIMPNNFKNLEVERI